MNTIFLSYARKDDETFVKRLYQDLRDQGFDVWWDRKKMPSRGLSFLRELQLAIANHDRLILVVGPGSLKSKVVAAELGSALRDCKIVIPILRLGNPRRLPQLLPAEIVNLHCSDFRESRPYDEALEELLRILRVDDRPLGTLYRVQALPAHFIPRADQINQLEEIVLADDNQPVVITSARQTVALQGMGGVGKSVLAAAFARSCKVRRVFSDGLIWLTFGQQTEALQRLQLVGRLFSDGDQFYRDEALAEARLSELFHNKDCLFVLDDVWDVRQAERFVNALADTRCRLLVTTRDGEIVTAVGAQRHSVDVLTDEEAKQLLAEWSKSSVSDLPAAALEVAEECGNLPFALALCGAMVRDGNLWADLRDRLHEADLSFIEKALPNYLFPNVLKSLQVSVEALDKEDQRREKPLGARQHYLELAVFPPDTTLPEAAIATLWSYSGGLDRSTARKLLTTLSSKALLRTESEPPLRSASLHDLQCDYIRAVTGDLKPLHRKLLGAYEIKCAAGWPSVPHDGYILNHLSYHMIEADEAGELHKLLATETGNGRNGWYEAKEADSNLASYLADIRLAWRLTEEAYVAANDLQKGENIGLQARYAVMTSSVNSLAQNIPAAMLTALVEKKVWPVPRGLAYARQIPDDDQHAEAMVGLLPFVDPRERESWVRDLLKVAQRMESEHDRLNLLSKLVERLGNPKSDESMRAVLDEISSFKNGDAQAYILSRIAVHLSPALASEALTIARSVLEKASTGTHWGAVAERTRTLSEQVKALIGLAHRLPKSQREQIIAAALLDARTSGLTYIYAGALAALAKKQLPPEYESNLKEAVLAAQVNNWDLDKANSLELLIPLLRGEQQEALLPETLSALNSQGWDWADKAERYYCLAAKISPALREKILAFAQQLNSDYERISTVARLAPLFNSKHRDELWEQALAGLRERGDLLWFRDVLKKIAATLTPEFRDAALALVLEMSVYDEFYRVDALAALLPAFAGDEAARDKVLRKSLEIVKTLTDRYRVKDALELLAPFCSAIVLGEALPIGRAIRDTHRQIYGLDKFIPLLPDAEREEIFEIVLMVVEGFKSYDRANALVEMALHLPPMALKNALAMAERIEDGPLYRVKALVGLAQVLDQSARQQALNEAKAVAAKIDSADSHAEALVTIIPALAPDERQPYVQEGLALLNKIEDEIPHANMLVMFLPFLPETNREELLLQAWERVRNVRAFYPAVQALAPYIPEALARKTFDRWSYVADEFDRGEVIPALGRRLTDFGEWEEVYEAFGELKRNKIEALTALAQGLPYSMLDRVVKDTREIESIRREEILSALSVRHAQLGYTEAALALAREIITPTQRAEALTGLAYHLEGEKFNEAMLEAFAAVLQIEDAGERGSTLRILAPRLAQCPTNQLYDMHKALMADIATRVRFQAIPELYMLSPVLAALGGTKALMETWRAVQDVYRWWS